MRSTSWLESSSQLGGCSKSWRVCVRWDKALRNLKRIPNDLKQQLKDLKHMFLLFTLPQTSMEPEKELFEWDSSLYSEPPFRFHVCLPDCKAPNVQQPRALAAILTACVGKRIPLAVQRCRHPRQVRPLVWSAPRKVLPGTQKYTKSWPVGPNLEVLGHYVAYFWGPGTVFASSIRNTDWIWGVFTGFLEHSSLDLVEVHIKDQHPGRPAACWALAIGQPFLWSVAGISCGPLVQGDGLRVAGCVPVLRLPIV